MSDWTLKRLEEDPRATRGSLHRPDGVQVCWTLENVWAGNTPRISCIPAGRYRLRLRNEGGWHARLAKRFPAIHRGAIELADVPGRTFILIHPGNYHSDTLGCILPGQTRMTGPDGALAVGVSGPAYEAIYPQLLAHLQAEGGGFLHITDLKARTHAGASL